jgi:beta-glucosidase
MKRLTAWRKLAPLAALLLLSQAACSDDDEKPTPNDPDPTDPEPVNPIPELTHLADWPRVQSAFPRDEALEARIDALVKSMSLEEKVGQMTQPQIDSITPAEVQQYHIGSVLNGGGNWPNGKKEATVEEWLAKADAFWAASMDPGNAHPIPIMWGTDAVHGHNNVKGATMFPHNIGLGATRDPELLKRIGAVTASEVARTGIDWAFGPTVAVVRDDRWGRTYEGYSEDPQIVAAYAGKITEGLQGQLGKDAQSGEKVAASVKHFLGDGATTKGKDQGVTVATEDQLINLHGRGYFTALEAGAQTVMISFSSWQNPDEGANAKARKMHGHKYLMTDVLKNKVGFDGFFISDWNGVGQLTTQNSDSPVDCTTSNCAYSINAGMDMIMVPSDWKAFIQNTLASVRNGEIPEERINDAVRRILRVKFRMGLFDKPKPSARTSVREVGTAEHRAVAREAVRKSLVLLKNNGSALPLARKAKILVAGKSANSLSNQSGGWSLTWQGTGNTNEQFGGGTTLWGAIQKIAPNAVLDESTDGAMANDTFDAAVVAIGETPYAEGNGDLGDTKTLELATLRREDLQLIDSLKAKGVKKIITVLYSGRPLYANKEINRSDAFVAAWLPGPEGDGMADVLFSKEDGTVNFDFTGKLSYSWPKSGCQTSLNRNDANYDPLYAYGYGLTYAAAPAQQAAYSEESPAKGCGVQTPDGPAATVPLEVFNRDNQDGWVMRIGAPSNWAVDVALSTANKTVTPSGEVTAAPVDDRNGLQWAAVKTTWVSEGQIYMQSANGNNTRDLRGYLVAQGALVFDALLSQAPVSTVKVRVDCKHPCIGEVNVTDTLQATPLNTWKEMAIPLQCFADAGADFSLVNTPIVINSLGAMDLTVANIRWEPNRAGNITCTGTSGGVQKLTDATDVYVNGAFNTALFGAPTTWSSVAGGIVKVNAALDTPEGKVIDVVFEDLKAKGGNAVFTLPVQTNWLLDVSSLAATGGVQFDIKVLDYGTSTQNFWVKMVCDNKADTCRTGDIQDIITRPPVGTWTTLKLPFARGDYESNFDNKKLSSILEMLPAWNDQGGNIHFQLRNIRVVK